MNEYLYLGFMEKLANYPIIYTDREIGTNKLRIRIEGPGWEVGDQIDILKTEKPGFFGQLIGRKSTPISVERSHLPLHHKEYGTKFIEIPYNENELKERLKLHLEKTSSDKNMPSFIKQDRPRKVKEIYKALKREHPDMPAEMKARIAARQGKPGKQKQGPPYKGPIKEAVHKATLSKLIQSIFGAKKKKDEMMEKKALLSSLMLDLANASPIEASKKVERRLGGQDVASQKLLELTNLSKAIELNRRKPIAHGGHVIDHESLVEYKDELKELLKVPSSVIESAIQAGRHLAEVERGAGKLDIVAHELGHAQNMGDILNRYSKPVALASSLGGMALNLAPQTRKWAPLVVGLGQIPVLAEEGRASYQAMKDLDALYAQEKIEEKLKTQALSESRSKLLKNWGTYAGGAVEDVGMIYALGKFYDLISKAT
jgi:hypothetical protein